MEFKFVSSQSSLSRRPSARSRLMAAAAQLFYNNGIVGTGVDAIVAKAGVAKMSLYNNFGSKADLVAAYISERHEEWLALYRVRLSKANAPHERVLAVFDAYLDHAEAEYECGFRGCGILNAAAELPARTPGRAAVRHHKEEVEDLVRGHLMEFPNIDEGSAHHMAEHMAFLLEGSIMRAGLEHSSERIRHARSIAQEMMRAL